MVECKIQDKTRNIYNIEICSVAFVNRSAYHRYISRIILLLDTKFLQGHETEDEYLLRLYR